MRNESELRNPWGKLTVLDAMCFGAILDTKPDGTATMWYQGHTYSVSAETVSSVKDNPITRHLRCGRWIVRTEHRGYKQVLKNSNDTTPANQ